MKIIGKTKTGWLIDATRSEVDNLKLFPKIKHGAESKIKRRYEITESDIMSESENVIININKKK